jgi:hypothetical protein
MEPKHRPVAYPRNNTEQVYNHFLEMEKPIIMLRASERFILFEMGARTDILSFN